MNLQNDRYIIKELSMIIKNMFACISENEEDNFLIKNIILNMKRILIILITKCKMQNINGNF